MTALIAFMVGINKMDRLRVSPREALILFAVKSKPGMNGVELANALNMPARSSVQNQVFRMCARGYVEDRRVVEHDLTPSDFHITPAGEALLRELTPA